MSGYPPEAPWPEFRALTVACGRRGIGIRAHNDYPISVQSYYPQVREAAGPGRGGIFDRSGRPGTFLLVNS